ncbi:MAG: hypothetical protein HZB80_01735 [Deltaproteobacteria bacterium]|nr:hypothetical protein [Deltaproteobacteria bacterium]
MAEVNITIKTEDKTLLELGNRVLDYLAARDNNMATSPAPGVKVNQNKVDDEKKKEAVRLLKSGMDANTAAAKTGLSPNVVRAYKAHITMGTY